MKFQLASDLHLEFRDHDFRKVLTPSAPILVLAGDICPLGPPEHRAKMVAFLGYYAPQFQVILHVPGNHEYYNETVTTGATMEDIDHIGDSLSRTFPNYRYMRRNRFCYWDPTDRAEYCFVGTTLWTHIPSEHKKRVAAAMNDYLRIKVRAPTPVGAASTKVRNLHPDVVNALFKENVRFIKNCLSRYTNIILITHHKPFVGTPGAAAANPVLYAYEADLGQWIADPVLAAVHGHTHEAMHVRRQGVLLASNPRGYPYQRTGYNPAMVLSVRGKRSGPTSS